MDINDISAGMVYIMTNAHLNEIAAFRRMGSGRLELAGLYPTNGAGSGARGISSTPGNGVDPLQSQGSLVLSGNSRLLFAVNAGSDSITSFKVSEDGSLALADMAPAGGTHPNCLAASGSILYAAHAGGRFLSSSSGIAGYFFDNEGRLAMISGSISSLSAPNAHPASIAASPDGDFLVVCELNTNRLSVFRIERDGRLSDPAVTDSSESGPFGSCFLPNGLLLVAEANTNALTSYMLSEDGALREVVSSQSDQKATCWVAATPGGRFAYTSNAGSGTVSGYSVMPGGMLSLIGSIPTTDRGPMGTPLDSGVSRDGCNLYVLNGNQGSVSVFEIDASGRLALIQVLSRTGLPSLGVQGMAVL